MLKICVPHLPKKIEILAVAATQTTNEFVEKCARWKGNAGFALAWNGCYFNDGCIIKIRRSYRFVK
jgi:hypothetical protein